jgi:2-polyprenyl-6-methoxyphenol hydroxylase-like FAD-dependent oxidoreductase
MTTTLRNDPVLVVGAGPTGLTLAAQLLARGIPTRIIDRNTDPSPFSRALGVHARMLELLDTMGLADAFVDAGHPVRYLRMLTGRRSLLVLDHAHNGSRFGFSLHLPQRTTEALLHDRVRELGGTVERGLELVGLSARPDGVDVTLRDAAGREQECGAGHVVGCDGAHSRVRSQLRLPFPGQPYPQDWLLADVTLDGAGPETEARLFFRADGLPLTCLPVGGGRWRVVMANAGDRGGRHPSLDEIRDLVAQRAPWPIDIRTADWLSCFRCQLRRSPSYRRGRVLLAGDAAHVHSPAGGRGMNTGIMDAANLAWKLALVVEGRAPDALLDTYGQERAPEASQALRWSDGMVRLMTLRRPVHRALRDSLLPAAGHLPAVQRRVARAFSQTSAAYRTGALVAPEGSGRGPRPGDRVADVEVTDGGRRTRLHEVLRGGRHVLLLAPGDGGVPTPAAPAGLDGLVDVVEGRLGAADGPGAFALVRPDGFLAARGARADTGRLVGYLQRLGVQAVPKAARAAAVPAGAGASAGVR